MIEYDDYTWCSQCGWSGKVVKCRLEEKTKMCCPHCWTFLFDLREAKG